MQSQEEFVGSNDPTLIMKRKRTKRPRSSSPFRLAALTSSSSSGGETGVLEDYNSNSISSPTTSGGGEIYESTEEEDMANCLIMLARGVVGGAKRIEKNRVSKMHQGRFNSRKFSELSGGAGEKTAAGFYVYECKTCNRSFPSFQALGGHRASHKKPKFAAEEKKSNSNSKSPISPPRKEDFDSEETQLTRENPVLSLQINNIKAKVHGCSICGSEFNSGQALGGHMRRHRAAAAAAAAAVVTVNQTSLSTDTSATVDSRTEDIKPRNILSLDLNLPAPEDDIQDTKFQFGSSKQAMVFSTPALVDCHY